MQGKAWKLKIKKTKLVLAHLFEKNDAAEKEKSFISNITRFSNSLEIFSENSSKIDPNIDF